MTILNLGGADLLKRLVIGGSISAGAVLSYELLEIAKRDPKLLESVISWGPLFAIAVIGLLMLDRNFGQMIRLGQDNVQAQQRMSDAMSKIADKDDRQAEEVRRLASYNAVQTGKIMERLDRQDVWLEQIAEVTKIRLPGEHEEPRAKGASA